MSELRIELEENSFEVPSKSIKNLYFQEEHLIIQTPKETFKLTTFAQQQLFYHLRLPWRKTIDADNTPLLIANAIGKRAVIERNSLVFRKLHYHKDHITVASVVTTKYVELPVGEVKERFLNTLKTLNLNYKLYDKHKRMEEDSFTYGITSTKTSDKGRISSYLTLVVGHSGRKPIEVANSYVVESCGNKLPAQRYGVLIHRDDTKKQILDSLQKVTLHAVKRLEPTLNKIVQVETSKDVENIEVYFGKLIQNYPIYINTLLREKFYGEYSDLQGLWRISQTLSDVGTNGEIRESYRPRLQQLAFNVLIEGSK